MVDGAMWVVGAGDDSARLFFPLSWTVFVGETEKCQGTLSWPAVTQLIGARPLPCCLPPPPACGPANQRQATCHPYQCLNPRQKTYCRVVNVLDMAGSHRINRVSVDCSKETAKVLRCAAMFILVLLGCCKPPLLIEMEPLDNLIRQAVCQRKGAILGEW